MAEKDCTEVGLAEKSKPAAGEKIENEKLEGVKVQEAIIKLKLLGQMPDAVKDDPTVETINMYDELLSNVKTPLTREEVGVLIDYFPRRWNVWSRVGFAKIGRVLFDRSAIK